MAQRIRYSLNGNDESFEAAWRICGMVPKRKVALEVAVGASAAGARVLVTMKHVGVNVCADPLFTAAYTGVNGGLVILAADDLVCFPLKTNKTLVTTQWLLWCQLWNQQILQKRINLRKTPMASRTI